MKELNLKKHQSSQCHVEVDDETKTIRFISYRTLVVDAIPSKTESGKYIVQGYDASAYNQKDSDTPFSSTTARQIGWFIKEYFPELSYYDIKESAVCGNCFIVPLSSDRKWLVE